jgi:hypothetical protein
VTDGVAFAMTTFRRFCEYADAAHKTRSKIPRDASYGHAHHLVEAASWTAPRSRLRCSQDRPSTSSNRASRSRRRLPEGEERARSAAAAAPI